MRLTKLHIQAALVIGLIALVGWSQFRPRVNAVALWRTDGPLTPRPELIARDGRLTYDESRPDGSGSGNSGPVPPDASLGERGGRQTAGSPGRRTAAFSPGTSGRTTINGRARTSFNAPIPFARVLLRNRQSGRIEAAATADINGQFSFDHLLLSGYIVELLGANGAVIAASEMAAGSLQFATLRVGSNASPRALFGTSDSGAVYLEPTASEPIGRAADGGAGQTTPPRDNASPRT